MTLRAIEQGQPTVSMGAYAQVLFSMSLEEDLLDVAKDSILKMKLEDIKKLFSNRSLLVGTKLNQLGKNHLDIIIISSMVMIH